MSTRLFNMRPLVVWAFMVAITVVLMSVSIWAATAWIVFIVIALYACQKKFEWATRAFIGISILLCMSVIISFTVTTAIHQNARQHTGRHTLSGVVETYTERVMTLSGATFNGRNVNGRVMVFIRNFDETHESGLEVGARVSFTSNLNVADANHQNINNRVMYRSSVNYRDILVIGQSYQVKHVIQRHSRNFLARFLDPPNASIMSAMLFGNRSGMYYEVTDNFRIAGLTHVLSVSGLHVGLVIGMVVALLKVLRIKRQYQLPIIIAVLLFYCYLCDFRFSVVRASIMFCIWMFCRNHLRRSDMPSSIAAAAIVTLIIFPYALWSWSFMLSYASMFGIAIFYNPIYNVLRKTIIQGAPRWLYKTQNFLIRGMTIWLCVNIATLPLVIMFFGAIPIFGIISNLLFLPILIIAFKVTVFALVTWVGGALLYPVNYLITAVRIWSNAVANLPIARIYVSTSGYWFLFYFLALLLLSRFIFLPRVYKYSAATFLFGVYFLTVLV